MEGCHCSSLANLAVVPMGFDGLDERVFATIETTRDHGGDLWWLHLSRCANCGQDWLVAQEERIYDNFCLKRLSQAEAQAITNRNAWPEDFTTYEQLLRLGKTKGSVVFLDPRSPSLNWTAKDLVKERPDMTVKEIADLLCISPKAAKHFLKRSSLDRLGGWIGRLTSKLGSARRTSC